MPRLIAPMLLALALASPAAAETRALSGFTSVDASGKYRVEVSQGEGFAVSIDGSDAGRVETEVERGVLRITQPTSWFGLAPARRLNAVVRVRMPTVEALSAARGVTMIAADLTSQRLELSAAQGAQLNVVGVSGGSVALSAEQGAAIEAAGVCESLEANASMGGSIEADDLVCARGAGNASMGGVLEMRASTSIEANASMGGVIDVTGSPATRSSSSSMGGSVDIN